MVKRSVGFLLVIGCPLALSCQLFQTPVWAGNVVQTGQGTLIAQRTAAAQPAAQAAGDDDDDSDTKPAAPEKPKTIQTYKNSAATSQAPAKESAGIQATTQRVYAEIGKGNNKEALQLIADAVKKEPNSIEARRYYAFALVHNDLPKDAIDQILYAMPRLPGYQRTSFDWCTLGDAYLQAGSYKNAETSYNTVLKTEADNHAAKGGLLRTTAKRGKVDDALKECTQLINQYSKQPAVQAYYKGIYALLLKDKSQPESPPPVVAPVNPEETPPGSTEQKVVPQLPPTNVLGG